MSTIGSRVGAPVRAAPILAALVLVATIGRPALAADPFELDCDEGRVLAGIGGRTGYLWWYFVVDEVEALCVAVNPDGSWAEAQPVSGGVASAGGGDDFELLCPRDFAVFKIDGTRGAVVDSLRVFCRALNDPQIVQTEPIGDVGGFGAQLWEDSCTGGNPIGRGLSGEEGWVVDQLALDCGSVPYATVTDAPVLDAPLANAVAQSLRPTFEWHWDPAVAVGFSQLCVTAQDHPEEVFCDVLDVQVEDFAHTPTVNLAFNGAPVFWSVRGCNVAGECGPFASPSIWLNPPTGPAGLPGLASFEDDLYPVYAHPRCANCHAGYGVFEYTNVEGGHPDAALSNRGNAAFCAACHAIDDGQWRNWKRPDGTNPEPIPAFAHLGPPGSGGEPHIPAQICETVSEEVRAVDWDAAQFEEHVAEDALIGWAFDPAGNMDNATAGQSASDEMPREDFVLLSMAWFEAGMPCDEGFPDPFVAAGFAFFSGHFAHADLYEIVRRGGIVLLPKDVLGGVEIGPRPPIPVDPLEKRMLQAVEVKSRITTRKEWYRGPVPAPLTDERAGILDKSGLHPRAASIDDVRKALRSAR